MIRVTREDFESFKRHNNPEVFTQDQINAWVDMHKEVLQKSELNELDELEKAEVDAFTEEFRSFMQIEVVGRSADLLTKGLTYERFYVRERQVEFEKAEGDEIEKSRKGKYLDTALNRKLGRVGREYGKSAKPEDDAEERAFKEGHSAERAKEIGDRAKKEDSGKPNEGYGKGDKTEASQHTKEELDEFDSHLDKLGKDYDKRHKDVNKSEDGSEKAMEEGGLTKCMTKAEEVEKGGEGSRGGKVIGHTNSGKPIYDTFDHPSHAKFSRNDHFDAGNTHSSMNEHVTKHREAANAMAAKKGSEKHPEMVREEKKEKESKHYS